MKLRTDYANAITETCGTLGGCVSLLAAIDFADHHARAFRIFQVLEEATERFSDGEMTQADGRKVLAAFLREMLATLEGKPC